MQGETLLCLYFPKLATELTLRRRPQLAGRPLVVIDGIGDDAQVLARSGHAGDSGVIPGMSAGQARRLCPSAAFVPENPGERQREMESVAALLAEDGFQHVEVGGPDHLVVALNPARPLSPAHQKLLADSVAQRSGLSVRSAIAPTPAEALELARASRRYAAFPAAATPAPASTYRLRLA
jgi:nucleotidyltransferase/DNA polymerase involved in DNA repair